MACMREAWSEGARQPADGELTQLVYCIWRGIKKIIKKIAYWNTV